MATTALSVPVFPTTRLAAAEDPAARYAELTRLADEFSRDISRLQAEGLAKLQQAFLLIYATVCAVRQLSEEDAAIFVAHLPAKPARAGTTLSYKVAKGIFSGQQTTSEARLKVNKRIWKYSQQLEAAWRAQLSVKDVRDQLQAGTLRLTPPLTPKLSPSSSGRTQVETPSDVEKRSGMGNSQAPKIPIVAFQLGNHVAMGELMEARASVCLVRKERSGNYRIVRMAPLEARNLSPALKHFSKWAKKLGSPMASHLRGALKNKRAAGGAA